MQPGIGIVKKRPNTYFSWRNLRDKLCCTQGGNITGKLFPNKSPKRVRLKTSLLRIPRGLKTHYAHNRWRSGSFQETNLILVRKAVKKKSNQPLDNMRGGENFNRSHIFFKEKTSDRLSKARNELQEK